MTDDTKRTRPKRQKYYNFDEELSKFDYDKFMDEGRGGATYSFEYIKIRVEGIYKTLSYVLDPNLSMRRQHVIEPKKTLSFEKPPQWVLNQEYLETWISVDPQPMRAYQILSICSKDSIISNRENLISYFLSCYGNMVDIPQAIFLYDASFGRNWHAKGFERIVLDMNNPTLREVFGFSLNFEKGVTKEEVHNFIDSNWTEIELSLIYGKPKRAKKDEVLARHFVEWYLCSRGIKRKEILENIHKIFCDGSRMEDQVPDSFTVDSISVDLNQLKKRLDTDWFDSAYKKIMALRNSNSDFYWQIAKSSYSDEKMLRLSFDSKNKNSF